MFNPISKFKVPLFFFLFVNICSIAFVTVQAQLSEDDQPDGIIEEETFEVDLDELIQRYDEVNKSFDEIDEGLEKYLKDNRIKPKLLELKVITNKKAIREAKNDELLADQALFDFYKIIKQTVFFTERFHEELVDIKNQKLKDEGKINDTMRNAVDSIGNYEKAAEFGHEALGDMNRYINAKVEAMKQKAAEQASDLKK